MKQEMKNLILLKLREGVHIAHIIDDMADLMDEINSMVPYLAAIEDNQKSPL